MEWMQEVTNKTTSSFVKNEIIDVLLNNLHLM